MARAGLRGDVRTISDLKRNLRALPLSMAHDVAKRSAPALTEEVQGAFDSGRNVYGESRPESVDGGPLSLVKTGATKRLLRFRATGRLVGAVLGTTYARFLIGKYRILPMGGMPAEWSRRLSGIVAKAQVRL